MLKTLESKQGESDTEVVHAKYVLGADGEFVLFFQIASCIHPHTLGAHSWVRNEIGFSMDGEQTGTLVSITQFLYYTIY